MSEELHTVEQAAQRLKLHPATILRFIRDGRLAATKVGKSYRIQRSDLDRLAGAPARQGALSGRVQVTSIVDVADVDADRAMRIAAMTMAALNGRPHGAAPLRADVIHDPESAQLKIILIGGAQDCAAMLVRLHIWLED